MRLLRILYCKMCFYFNGRCIFFSHFEGLRHISILKLVGTELSDMGGVLELYPFNGKDLEKMRKYRVNANTSFCLGSHIHYSQKVWRN